MADKFGWDNNFGNNPAPTDTGKVGRLDVVARNFGFTAREVPLGFFLAPVTTNRFGHRHVGDDQMLVTRSGEIVPYAHDAQAFLAAKAVSAALSRAEQVKS